MTVSKGKIIEATRSELLNYYLTRRWDELYSFPEYLRLCTENGTKVTNCQRNEKAMKKKTNKTEHKVGNGVVTRQQVEDVITEVVDWYTTYEIDDDTFEFWISHAQKYLNGEISREQFLYADVPELRDYDIWGNKDAVIVQCKGHKSPKTRKTKSSHAESKKIEKKKSGVSVRGRGNRK